ncbi:MAG: ATP-binding protein [Anaerolineales bacterium]
MTSSTSEDRVKAVTSELNDELLREQLERQAGVHYRRVPEDAAPDAPGWRIRLMPAYDPACSLALEVCGEVTLGRGEFGADFVPLLSYEDAEQLGVSRRHILLRSDDNHLYVLDAGSTNGTWLNGASIGFHTPYALTDGDHLMVGHLELNIQLSRTESPAGVAFRAEHDLFDRLLEIGQRLTASLETGSVVQAAVDILYGAFGANEAAVWLVNPFTGELELEAHRGLEGKEDMRLPLTGSLAGQVVSSGKPMRATGNAGSGQIKIKTGYLVESVMYVPITIGGATIGVLSVAHHADGKPFSAGQEKLMLAVATYTAQAVQTARQYAALESGARRIRRIAELLHEGLTYDMKRFINSAEGYISLLADSPNMGVEDIYLLQQLHDTSAQTSILLDKLIELGGLTQAGGVYGPADVASAVGKAIDDMAHVAEARFSQIEFNIHGQPYWTRGDMQTIYRSVLKLLDNALRYAPPASTVLVRLLYGADEIIISVCDSGPGLPEDALAAIDGHFYRGGRALCGLGLAYVRMITEAHRGTLRAHNTEAGGAEVIMALPALRV